MSDATLNRLIGEWTFEGRSLPDDGEIRKGVERVRRQGVWLIVESTDKARFQLAFDAAAGRVTGDFLNWDDPRIWLFDGVCEGDRMVLKSRGPRMDGGQGETDYEDVWEFVSDDERRLTGRFLDEDGEMRDFTTTHYQRR